MKHAALLLAALAACYEPEAVNCTVSCAEGDECAEGQVCGSDHLCATPDVAGHCSSSDDDEPPASSVVMLRVTIEGDGKVSVDGVGSCDSRDTPVCTFSVTVNVPRALKAVEGGEREFVAWSQACASATEDSCELVPVMPVTAVGAVFD